MLSKQQKSKLHRYSALPVIGIWFVSLPLATGPALGAELMKIEQPQKLELKKTKPKKLNIQKAEPKHLKPKKSKTKTIAPKTKPKKLGKKITKPDVKPSITKPAKLDRQVEPKLRKKPGMLNKAAIKPPKSIKPIVRKQDLAVPSSRKSRLKSLSPSNDAPGSDTKRLQSQTSAGIVDTGSATGLNIDPDTGFSKELKSLNLKELTLRPKVQGGLVRELKGDPTIDRQVAGIETGDKSSLGDGVGLRKWRSDGIGDPVGKYAGLNTGRITKVSRGTVLQGDEKITAFWTSPYGKEYVVVVGPEGTTQEEFNDAAAEFDDGDGTKAGLPVPGSTWNKIQEEWENGDRDSSAQTLDAALLHAWMKNGMSDEEAEAESSAGSGETQTASTADQNNSEQDPVLVSDTTDEDGDRTMTFAPADEETDESADGSNSDDQTSDGSDTSNDDNGVDGGSDEGGQDVAAPEDDSQDDSGGDSECADGDSNCSGETGMSMGGDEQENAPPPPGGCGENGENCEDPGPANEGGGDGTLRMAEGEEGNNGPLASDPTAAVNPTLNVQGEVDVDPSNINKERFGTVLEGKANPGR